VQPQKRFLIPVRKYTGRPGLFRWPRRPRFCAAHPEDVTPLAQLADDLGRRFGLAACIGEGCEGTTCLQVFRDPRIRDRQAYRIAISRESIAVYASSDAGAYYAIQTLRDMLAFSGRAVPCCMIEDSPDFVRRGIYHDCSRGKVPKLSTLIALVERLAHWKINELQLYVENVFAFRNHPEIGKGYSPLTRAEILALQEHCRLHHVQLVGSLASLGHMEKILALPGYTKLGELPGYRGWAGGTTLCPTDPRSIKLVGELYDEFIPLFEAEDFNVCGDEPWELGQGRSKRVAGRIGKGQVYLNYILKLYELCQKHGKRMNMWADIVLQHPELLSKLPRDIVLLNWEYEQDGPRTKRTKDIADAGLPSMVCPGTSAWNTHGSRLPNATINILQAAQEGFRHGAEGLLNTDWGDNGHRNFLGVSLHGFAFGAACSWNGRSVDPATFTATFCSRLFGPAAKKLAPMLRELGTTYLMCDAPYNNECALYYALAEPLAGPQPSQRSRVDAMTDAGCHLVIERFDKLNECPKHPDGLDQFEWLTMSEYSVAANMDTLAAMRAIVARKLRGGGSIDPSELEGIAALTRVVATMFRLLWLHRNKTSRLCDNMAMFKRIEVEALKLARRR
jgi:hexosaminidase